MSKNNPLGLLEKSGLQDIGFSFSLMSEQEGVIAIEIRVDGGMVMVVAIDPKARIARYLKIGSNHKAREKAIAVLNNSYDIECLNP